MSSQEYYKRWLDTKEQLELALNDDERLQQLAHLEVGIKPQATAVEMIAKVYCKFCELYNKLCEIYDMMLQPQRAEYLKKIIDAITCRILELKTALQNVEAFQYTYYDNALQQLFLIPHDVQILCPFFYSFETRREEMQYIIDEIFAGNRIGDPEPSPSEIERREQARLEEEARIKEEKEAEIRRKLALGEEITESVHDVNYTPQQLETMRLQKEFDTNIGNIQRMERCRVVIFNKIQKANKDRTLFLELSGQRKPKIPEILLTKCATLIQKFYRRFMELKREYVKDNRLKLKLDMIISSYQTPSSKVQLEKVREARRKFRREYYKKWVDANVKEKSHILRFKEGPIMEDISDEIRQWFRYWWTEAKVFDEFPFEGEGGSILIVRGETQTIEEWEVWNAIEEKRVKVLAQNPKTKEQIKEEKRAEREEKKRLAKDARDRAKKKLSDYKKSRMNPNNDPGVYLPVGKHFEPLHHHWFMYQDTWKYIDIPEPLLEVFKGHIRQLIIENKYKEINLELRPIVDELMRLELKLLRAALKLYYESIKMNIPLVMKRKKPRKPKKPKPEKGNPATMFQKLVDAGIVRKYPRTTLEDYLGDRNYAAADCRAVLWTPSFPPPCMGDIQEEIRINCILTLGASCSNVVRSQLLAGPKGSCKKTLVYAVATETNSILIDLSPLNVYDKMPGKKGLKSMMTLVNKVSRLMQPTVILVADADHLFYKRVPKEEKDLDPCRLMGNFYKDIVKPLKSADKILVMGTASEPWVAKAAKMKKAFPSVILVPKTDYASLSFILSKTLLTYHGVGREFDVHSLAQALRGFDVNTILKSIKKVMTGKRIAELAFKPLHPLEIVNVVVDDENAVYTDDVDYAMYRDWYNSYSVYGTIMNEFMLILESQLAVKIKTDKQKKKKKA